MDYELAKKLKDAGFPQNCDDTIAESLKDSEIPYYKRSVANPNLSELIEVCGEIGIHIINCNDTHPWCAWTKQYPNGDFGIGVSPEEAVANLWLKLHEKAK
jgi:hypothetical protein